MKQVLIELDDATAAELERVAPSRKRLRTRFLRTAIRKALDAFQERETAAAYRRAPDSPDDWFLDPEVWDDWPAPSRSESRR